MTLVRDAAPSCDAAVRRGAARTPTRALVESYVELGREVRCGVARVRDGELVCLPLEEYAVDPVAKPIRGQRDKLRPQRRRRPGPGGQGRRRTRGSSPDDDPVTERVWAAARAAATSRSGCRHYSLFDFRIDPDGKPWFLEAGLYCSYAPSSVIAVMAAAAGIERLRRCSHAGAAAN